MALIPYAADDVIIDFGGVQLHGLQKGSFAKWKLNADLAKLDMGADGEAVLVRSRDSSGTLEVTLQQDSASNDWLSTQANLFFLSGGGMLPLAMKDLTGRTLRLAPVAWVKTYADSDYGDDASPRVWTLEFAESQNFVGGRG